MSKNYFIYILKLEEKKYYVGYTNNIDATLQYHNNGYNNWTKNYKIVKVKKLIKIKDNLCEIKTKEKTLELMKKYKWQNVRGSIWNKINIDMPIEIKKN
tara:strand:+ start:2934 stop:3230 length:297 start_codon:yes stop_codon:yes gene_type:complete